METTEQQQEIVVTSAQRTREFAEKFAKAGFSLEKKYEWIRLGEEVVFTTFVCYTPALIPKSIAEKLSFFDIQTLAPEMMFKQIPVCSGHSMQSRFLSEFNEVNFFETAETISRSRALAEFGILIQDSMLSVEEILISSKEMKIRDSKKKHPVRGTPREALGRLKISFEEGKSEVTVNTSKVPDKAKAILVKYGFIEQGEFLNISTKEFDGK